MLKRTLVIVAWNLLLLAAGLVVLELIFGGWINSENLFQSRIIRNVQFHYPVDSIYDNGGRKITYTRDEFGLRGDFADPAAIDILTLGGSTTDQRYIDDSKTWQEVMEDRFREAGYPLYVANAGVDGQTTFGHIYSFANWLRHIPGLKPCVVLFYTGTNDRYISAPKPRNDFPVVDPITETSLYDYVIGNLKLRSAIYNAIINLRGLKGGPDLEGEDEVTVKDFNKIGHGGADFSRYKWQEAGHWKLPDDDLPDPTAFGHRLERLAELTKDFGATPIFVTQGTFSSRKAEDGTRLFRSRGALRHYLIDRLFAAKMMEVCQENDLICFDLFSDLFEDLGEEDFYDWTHNTPAGARKIGSYIASSLLRVMRRGRLPVQPNCRGADMVSTSR